MLSSNEKEFSLSQPIQCYFAFARQCFWFEYLLFGGKNLEFGVICGHILTLILALSDGLTFPKIISIIVGVTLNMYASSYARLESKDKLS